MVREAWRQAVGAGPESPTTAEDREGELERRQGCEFSKPTPNGALPPHGLHLPEVPQPPKHCHKLELNVEIHEPMGVISHSNHYTSLETGFSKIANQKEPLGWKPTVHY